MSRTKEASPLSQIKIPLKTEYIFLFIFTLKSPIKTLFAHLYPLENIRKPKGFMMFSGGIDKQNRAAMS